MFSKVPSAIPGPEKRPHRAIYVSELHKRVGRFSLLKPKPVTNINRFKFDY